MEDKLKYVIINPIHDEFKHIPKYFKISKPYYHTCVWIPIKRYWSLAWIRELHLEN